MGFSSAASRLATQRIDTSLTFGAPRVRRERRRSAYAVPSRRGHRAGSAALRRLRAQLPSRGDGLHPLRPPPLRSRSACRQRPGGHRPRLVLGSARGRRPQPRHRPQVPPPPAGCDPDGRPHPLARPRRPPQRHDRPRPDRAAANSGERLRSGSGVGGRLGGEDPTATQRLSRPQRPRPPARQAPRRASRPSPSRPHDQPASPQRPPNRRCPNDRRHPLVLRPSPPFRGVCPNSSDHLRQTPVTLRR